MSSPFVLPFGIEGGGALLLENGEQFLSAGTSAQLTDSLTAHLTISDLSFNLQQLAMGAAHLYNLNENTGALHYIDTGNVGGWNSGTPGSGSQGHSIASNAPGLVGDQTLCAEETGNSVAQIYGVYDPNGTSSFSVEALVWATGFNNIDRGLIWWNDTPDQTGEGLLLEISGHNPFNVGFEVGNGSGSSVGAGFYLNGSPLDRPFYICGAYDASTNTISVYYWDATNGFQQASATGAHYAAATHTFLEMAGPGNATYGSGYRLFGFYSSMAIYDFALTASDAAQNIACIPNSPGATVPIVLPASLSIANAGGTTTDHIPADLTISAKKLVNIPADLTISGKATDHIPADLVISAKETLELSAHLRIATKATDGLGALLTILAHGTERMAASLSIENHGNASLQAHLAIGSLPATLVLIPPDATLPYNQTLVYQVRKVYPDGRSVIPTGIFLSTAGTMDPAGITSTGQAVLEPYDEIGNYTVTFVETDTF